MRALLFPLHVAVTMPKMADDAIVSALWYLNVYGAIMARCCLMQQNSKVSGETKPNENQTEYFNTCLCAGNRASGNFNRPHV